ncbi:MAG: recombinase family protein [Thermoleophilia bacterium]
MTEDARPAVVIYAALSKKKRKTGDDRHDEESIDSQIAKVRGRLDVIYGEDGYDLLGAFTDTGHSGSKKNRGPDLEAAISAVTHAADQGRKVVELWANTSARFARGTGKKNEARSLLEVYTQLRRTGVAIRTVADDEFVTNPILISFAAEQAAKYTKDLSESLLRAKERQLARGDHLGGPICDGYAIVSEHNEDGKVIGRTFRPDPDRASLVRSIFDLAVQGVPDTAIMRKLNSQGLRTRHGRPFTRRAIQNTITNPFYAGRIAYKRGTPDEQIVQGHHPPLVDPARFDRIQKMRAARDHAGPDQKVIGRPAQNHALARLAVCGRCGERLHARTSTYRRKDGSRARFYACAGYAECNGTCDAKPINAEIVDAAVMDEDEGLPNLLLDYDAWRQQIEDGYAADRRRLAEEVARGQRDHDAQAHKTAAVERKWGEYIASGDNHKADLVLPMVERERQACVESERRLQAARDALASVPPKAPSDAMLDFQNTFRGWVNKRVDMAAPIAEINQALRELFSAFQIHETEYEHWPVDDEGLQLTDHAVRAKELIVKPFIKASVAAALDPTILEAWERRTADWAGQKYNVNAVAAGLSQKIIDVLDAPPVQPLIARPEAPADHPERNVQNSHEYL